MKTIYKYPLAITDEQIITMPFEARILTVQVQDGVPCLWALVEPDWKPEPRRILTFGTGHPIPDGTAGRHVGTYQVQGGSLVFHVFEGDSS